MPLILLFASNSPKNRRDGPAQKVAPSEEELTANGVAEMLKLAYPDNPNLAEFVTNLNQKYTRLKKLRSHLETSLQSEQTKVDDLRIKLAQKNIQMSNCLLDDTQYAQRFKSLDESVESLAARLKRGNIWNLADVSVSLSVALRPQDIGRGVIAAWISGVFNTYMHPALDVRTSAWLKSEVEAKIKTPSAKDLVQWRCMTVDALLPDELKANQDSRGMLESTDGYRQHKDKLVADFCATISKFVNSFFDPQIDAISQMIDQILQLMSTINRETRDIQVRYYRQRTPYANATMRMRIPGEDVEIDVLDSETRRKLEGLEIAWSAFVSVQKNDGDSFPLYRPLVWLPDDQHDFLDKLI